MGDYRKFQRKLVRGVWVRCKEQESNIFLPTPQNPKLLKYDKKTRSALIWCGKFLDSGYDFQLDTTCPELKNTFKDSIKKKLSSRRTVLRISLILAGYNLDSWKDNTYKLNIKRLRSIRQIMKNSKKR
jgi:hypothetical protein